MFRSPPTRLDRLVVAVSVMALVSIGCSSKSSKSQPASTPPVQTTVPVDTLAPPTAKDAAEVTVRATDNDFDPKHLQIRAGTTVRFTNIGHNKHNIIPDDPGLGNFSVTEDDFPIGSSYTFEFTKPGTYAYYCSLHATPTAGSMRGVITVTR